MLFSFASFGCTTDSSILTFNILPNHFSVSSPSKSMILFHCVLDGYHVYAFVWILDSMSSSLRDLSTQHACLSLGSDSLTPSKYQYLKFWYSSRVGFVPNTTSNINCPLFMGLDRTLPIMFNVCLLHSTGFRKGKLCPLNCSIFSTFMICKRGLDL